MKHYKKVVVKEIHSIPVKTICNCCGKKHKIVDNYFTGNITPVQIEFSYGSRFDGVKVDFDICDDCIQRIVSDFVHKKDFKDILK